MTGLDSIFDSSVDLRKDHLSATPESDYASDSSVDLRKDYLDLRYRTLIIYLTVLQTYAKTTQSYDT